MKPSETRPVHGSTPKTAWWWRRLPEPNAIESQRFNRRLHAPVSYATLTVINLNAQCLSS